MNWQIVSVHVQTKTTHVIPVNTWTRERNSEQNSTVFLFAKMFGKLSKVNNYKKVRK